jgi:uncharacterized protein (TIGR02391 family)
MHHTIDEGPLYDAITDRYLKRDLRDLEQYWPTGVDKDLLEQIKEHAHNKGQLTDIVEQVIPKIEDAIDHYYSNQVQSDLTVSILDLLHPTVIESSYNLFRQGHYRQAVFDAFVAVFDLIRTRTRLDADGSNLVGQVFSLETPILAIADLSTESGKNEQKGFLQMQQGAYLGIRNPKAHSLQLDPNKIAAAQNLVFASLLARRVEDAKLVTI